MKTGIISRLKAIWCMGLMFIFVLLYKNDMVFGASPVTINTVDYREENIIVNNNGNKKIYFATENDAARNVWDVITADGGATGTTSIDFSWVSPSTEQVIVVKGEDNVQSRVILRPRAKKLEVSINYDKMDNLSKTDNIGNLLNIMSSEGTANDPIRYSDLEWRKGTSGSWKSVTLLTVAQLEKLQVKGADLYFRIKAVNDTTDGSNGRRASNEVKLKIAKQSSPSSINIDGERFIAQIRYGKEHRVTYNGITTPWTKVTDKSVKGVALTDMINKTKDGLTPESRFPAMVIEVREYATATKAASKTTEISLKEQRVLSGTIKESEAPENAPASDTNIYITYNGSAGISITIPSASTENPYQYCVVKSGETFDLSNASWSTITRNTAVKVLSSKVPDGSTVYIRQKEIKAKAATKTTPAVDFALASTCVNYKVEYPAVPKIEPRSITFIKNVTEEVSFDIKMNTAGKPPFETKIKSIKYGTRELEFTCSPQEITVAGPPYGEYTMKVTLNISLLNSMANSYSRALTITYGNGTVDKNSIKMAIQNPTPASILSTTVSQGKTTGTVAIKVNNTVRSGYELVYKITDTKVEGVHTETVIADGTKFEQQGDIPVAAGKYITVYEINSTTKKVSRYSCMQISANQIKN